MENCKTEHQKEMETFDVMAQDNEAAEVKAVAEHEEIAPKHGEWWLGKWSGTSLLCAMQYSEETKYWHEHSIKAPESDDNFIPLERICTKNDFSTEQPKPKHTKEEYVRVKTVFDLNRDDMRSGFYGWIDDNKEFHPTYFEPECVNTLTKSKLYRKVVTELTDREAFIEQGLKALDQSKHSAMSETLGKLFDAGFELPK